jgi:hypothetical protein
MSVSLVRLQDVVRRFDFASHGFRRAGNAFYLDRGTSVAVIDFQRSDKSSKEQLIFTVNLGVYVRRIAQFFHPAAKDRPRISDCHWFERLGYVLPERSDKWWNVGSVEELDRAVTEIHLELTTYGVPELIRYLDPAELRDGWLDGRSPGLTDMQRLLNAALLLQEFGPHERLSAVLDELRAQSQGKPHEKVVKNHIERIKRAQAKDR